MEATFINLKREFEQYLASYQDDPTTLQRLKSLCELLPLIQSSVLNQTHMEAIQNCISSVLRVIKGEDAKARMAQYLDVAEERSINVIVMPLEILHDKFSQYLGSVRAQTFAFGYLLAGLIYAYTVEQANRQLQPINSAATIRTLNLANFDISWDLFLTNIIKIFRMQNNLFSKQFAKKMLCGDTIRKSLPINPNSFIEYIYHLCSNISDYNFVSSITRMYEMFPRSEGHFRQERLLMKCSYVSVKFENQPGPLAVDQGFEISPSGLIGDTLRSDSLVIFGKHRSADIKFPPEDQTMDEVALLLYAGSDKYLVVDCSKNCNVYFKLAKYVKYPLAEGMVFNIAQAAHFCIRKINNFTEGDDSDVYGVSTLHSELIIEYLDGQYANPIEGRPIKFSTKWRNQSEPKRSFTLGKSGAATVDVFTYLNGHVSSKHIEFSFEATTNNWYISDLYSKNGTYGMYKNTDQFLQKEKSNCVNLFPVVKTQEQEEERKIGLAIPDYLTLLVGNYTFFITRN